MSVAPVCVCALVHAHLRVCGLTAGQVRVGLKPCALCQGCTGAFFRIDELPAFLIKPSVTSQQNKNPNTHTRARTHTKKGELRGGEVTCLGNLSSAVTSCTDVMCRSFDIYYQNIKNWFTFILQPSFAWQLELIWKVIKFSLQLEPFAFLPPPLLWSMPSPFAN